MTIREQLAEVNPEAVVWPDLDDALVGIGQQFNRHLAVYDYEKIIDVLMWRGASYEEAVDHIHYNTLGQYTGPNDPIVLFQESE